MKAIIYTKYGSPDVLELKEIDKPAPADDEVLIRVYAASVNSWDWDMLTGKPFLYRLFSGMLKPKYNILGADVAGVVEVVGKNVKKFNPGDEVFGDLCESGWGCFAEYVCAREHALALKPRVISFEQAAALPQAGVLALQGIRDYGKVKKGQKVLINGAGGGVGTLAVQMAKALDAEVTGVDRTDKLGMLKSLGADHVIDYTREDFTKNGQYYDLILDVVAHRSVFQYRKALSLTGIFVMIGGSVAKIFQLALLGPLLSMAGRKKMGILIHRPNKDLAFLIELFETGKLKPVIGKRFTLSEVPDALRSVGEGNVFGKAVINLLQDKC